MARKVTVACRCGIGQTISEYTAKRNVKRNGQYLCCRCAIAEAQKAGKYQSCLTREQRSAKSRRVWADPAKREKIIAATRAAVTKPEFRASQSAATSRCWQDPEYARAVSDGVRSALGHQEARRRVSAGVRDRYASDPELRKKTGLIAKRRLADPAILAAHIARAKKQMADPEYQAKMRELYDSPEYRAELSERSLAVWQRPGYREKHREAFYKSWQRSPAPDVSSNQDDLASLIGQLTDSEITHNRRDLLAGCEIDIFMPTHNLGVEYHSLYWHSHDSLETPKQRNRHQNKAILASAANIKLLQFLETEVKLRRSVVESMLRHALGQSDRVQARKCQITTTANFKAFFDANHLYGHRPASVEVGLLSGGTLVAAASFSRHHKYGWELMRLATLAGHVVVGGASRLFSWFLGTTKPQSIICYADLRFSTGGAYRALGFVLDGITAPGYHYVRGTRIFSRQQFQKHKLAKKLPQFDPQLSESQNMFNNKYRRLWDAGHMRFIWSK